MSDLFCESFRMICEVQIQIRILMIKKIEKECKGIGMTMEKPWKCNGQKSREHLSKLFSCKTYRQLDNVMDVVFWP